jgi:PAS domain S-box-containing protein
MPGGATRRRAAGDGSNGSVMGTATDPGQELLRQRQHLEPLLEISPTATVISDPEATIVAWNPAAEKLFGYTAAEAVGRNIDDLVATTEELHQSAVGVSERVARKDRVHAITRRTRKDGSLIDVEMRAAPLIVDGTTVGTLGIYHDITELQRQKRFLQSLLLISPEAIVTTDREWKVRTWNPAAEKLFGYSAEEAIGRNVDDLVANRSEVHREATGVNERATERPIRVVTRRTRKDGSLIDVDVLGAPIAVGGERAGQLLIYHDTTELQREKRYFQSLLELSPAAIVVMDLDATVVSWNPAAEKLFGYSAEEAIGKHIDDLVAARLDLREEALAYSRAAVAGERIEGITRRTRKDGSLVDVQLASAPVGEGDERQGFLAIYHDVSELQRARQEAEAATHAKSAFLATMSHEIRTPLNAVIGMTGLLLDTELTTEQRNYAEVVRTSGDALLTVINEILDFSKIEAGRLELERQPFDLRQCVESALELVAADAAEKGLDVAYVQNPEAPQAIFGDVARLRQILLNLLNNAVKFTERGEVVVALDAERVAGDADRYRLHFAVRDTGIGIPEDRMDRLFESFSQVDPSTTRRYGGTGLGLAISRRLTELMDGTMFAESRVGQGSTFHFTITAEAAPAPAPAYLAEAPLLQGRRVLIVDDNATNREILRRQTESWGMLARDTESPTEALAWVRRGDPFDVAILDMQMPEMDGLSLAGEIRRHRDAGALPLVMLTSLGRRAAAETDPFVAHLTKPIKPSQLYDVLMAVFGRRTAELPTPPAPATAAGPAPSSALRILVAEDNAVNQQLALLLLRKLGYRADVAADGREALEALERQPYDVVLMDVHMPEMDGLEATRRIHGRWAETRPRIVAMTANALEGDREACLEAGMDDYISKPIREEELATALREVPGRRLEVTIDASALDRLRETVGTEQALSELTETFFRDTEGLLAELRRDLEAERPAEVRRHAHTLKSTAASFGATELSALCRRLEDLAGKGSLDAAAQLLPGIDAEFSRVRTALAPGR